MKTHSKLPDPALRATCSRILSGHGPSNARLWVERMAASPHLGLELDVYSEDRKSVV